MNTEREEVDRQRRVMAEFGELALRSDDLATILHEACRLVGEALGTELAKVMELQPDAVTLRVVAGVGWPAGVVGQARVRADATSSEGHALQTGHPVISPDIATEQRFTYARFITESGVQALANVIIHGADHDRPYGILQVDSRQPRAFTPQDTEFLRAYANLLGAAVVRLREAAEIRALSRATEANAARLRTLIDALPQLVWRVVGAGRLTWVSAQWTAFTGLSLEASRDGGWLAALHPDDHAHVRAAWADAGQRGRFEVDGRVRHTATNHYRWFQMRATPVRDAAGGIIEWIGTSTDIDDQVRAREILSHGSSELEARVAERTAELRTALAALQSETERHSRSAEQLRQSEKLKAVGQLTGGIAHDFNNLLQSITGSIALIRHRSALHAGQGASGRLGQGDGGQGDGGQSHGDQSQDRGESQSGDQTGVERTGEAPGPPDLTRYLDTADRAATRAATLTQRLLAFARQQTLSPRHVNLDAIARGMEDLVRRTMGPAVQVELKPGDGEWLVMCDPNQLESALLNLCVNARDAMPAGGRLTIATADLTLAEADIAGHEDAVPGPYAAIAVTDTGTGMPPDIAGRVFEPFFTTKPMGQGTGLGLSQIYGFVRQSGGLVQIETEPGRGTTVRLCLPGHQRRATPLPAAPDAATTRTVLLVEDQHDVRDITAEMLRDCGYRVLEAENGPAALRVLEAGARIDLLVSDVGLPGGMNGRQVAEALRERIPGLPVILVTGFAGGDPMPGLDVLLKPFRVSALIELVRAKLAPA